MHFMYAFIYIYIYIYIYYIYVYICIYICIYIYPYTLRRKQTRNLSTDGRGVLCNTEISKVIDMYMFLFDDILLLTKVKKAPRKKTAPAIDHTNPYLAARVQTDGAIFVVYRQPIALDRFVIHDIRPSDASGTSPIIFVSRYPCPVYIKNVNDVSLL